MSYVLLTVVDCGPLNNPDNGEVTTSGFKYLNLAVYSCTTSGYILIPSDSSVRVCGADGEWTINPPTCEREL